MKTSKDIRLTETSGFRMLFIGTGASVIFSFIFRNHMQGSVIPDWLNLLIIFVFLLFIWTYARSVVMFEVTVENKEQMEPTMEMAGCFKNMISIEFLAVLGAVCVSRITYEFLPENTHLLCNRNIWLLTMYFYSSVLFLYFSKISRNVEHGLKRMLNGEEVDIEEMFK